jgi:hypothetical protein
VVEVPNARVAQVLVKGHSERVGDVALALEGRAEQHAHDALARVPGHAVVVIHDAQQHQRMRHYLLRELHVRRAGHELHLHVRHLRALPIALARNLYVLPPHCFVWIAKVTNDFDVTFRCVKWTTDKEARTVLRLLRKVT